MEFFDSAEEKRCHLLARKSRLALPKLSWWSLVLLYDKLQLPEGKDASRGKERKRESHAENL